MAQWRGVAVPADVPGLPSGQQELPCWVFDAFRLDRRDERLWRGQEVVPLHPKPFAVLCCLVTQAGQLVTKDALLEAVWPETVVSEAVLAGRHSAATPGVGRSSADAPVYRDGARPGLSLHRAGPRPGVSRRASGDGGEAPHQLPRFRRPPHFVGRDAALTQLRSGGPQHSRAGGRWAIIAGEPGIGKTALVDAFLAQVAARGACRVGHGQCVEPYGPGEPYLPVLEALGTPRPGTGWRPRCVAVLRQYAPSWLVQMPALVPPAEWEALQRAVGHPARRGCCAS